MGMAASQARFLGLTARKSNVEYQGQQVNQQRTALANESANLYNQMMTLDVPTPPSTTDYYKTTYELEDSETAVTSGNYTIGSISKAYSSDNPNLYRVSLNYQTKEIKSQDYSYKISKDSKSTKKETEKDYSYVYTTTDSEGKTTSVTKKGNIDKYSFYVYDESISQDGKTGGFTLTMYGNPMTGDPSGTEEQQMNAYGTNAYTGTDGSMQVQSGIIYKVDPNKTLEGKDECCPNLGSENYYFYKLNGNTYFMTETELEELMDATETTATAETQDGYLTTTRSYTKTNDFSVDVDATLEKSSTGRYSSITIVDDDGNAKNLQGKTFALNVKQVFDQEKYDNAMNDYNFQKDIYEKAVADINAKTEVIQKQDQNLELRLDQLDTEQNAIKTEMDAVTKVLRDNVEKTFKTFNA